MPNLHATPPAYADYVMAMLRCLILTLALLAVPAPAQSIAIEAAGQGDWRATYTLDRPARALMFQSNPNDARARGWTPQPGFEIVRTQEVETLRRIDGRPFRRATVAMPPVYEELPAAYAPFSPFGDGGMLFQTGRFFACADRCGDDPSFAMTLSIPRGRYALIDGNAHRGSVRWIDHDSGRGIYVGRARAIDTGDLVGIIDPTLPPPLLASLREELPAFIRYFADLLGRLESRPMVFASLDPNPHLGWGRQGGVLPGQVFMHFYGSGWERRIADRAEADGVTWHFAHEAAHLYQRNRFIASHADYWFHEGGADALTALAFRARGGDAAAYADRRIAAARADCRDRLKGRSVRDASVADVSGVPYACGLIANLALDTAIRRHDPASDGLFTLWRAVAAGAEALDRAGLDRIIRAYAGTETADRLESWLSASNPDLDSPLGISLIG